MQKFPISQRELLLYARGDATQRVFAKELGVKPSSYSRYESEKLGAPVHVISSCLKKLFGTRPKQSEKRRINTALTHAQKVVEQLENLGG
ncbi:MAG: helix-turn-helix domain-containing protein [Rhodocyclaceae bacterium]|nr:helix-turn-helix domain-containing protein [Rhodocyclaceae bacterium]